MKRWQEWSVIIILGVVYFSFAKASRMLPISSGILSFDTGDFALLCAWLAAYSAGAISQISKTKTHNQ